MSDLSTFSHCLYTPSALAMNVSDEDIPTIEALSDPIFRSRVDFDGLRGHIEELLQ